MKRFIKWLFKVEDEPQSTLKEEWRKMRVSILGHDIEQLQKERAYLKAKLDGCKKHDAGRAPLKDLLKRATSKQLKCQVELNELWSEQGRF